MLGHRPLVVEDYLSILKRRGWMVLLPVLILPIVGYAFSFTIPPQFLSKSLVLVDGQKVPEGFVKSVISSDLDSRLDSEKQQILSRSQLQPIVERYGLYPTGHGTIDERIDLVRKDIDIQPVHADLARSGGLPGFNITFKAGDAHTAQLVCADITSLFLTANLHSREQSAEGTTEFLRGQLNDAKRNLDEQDAKLEEFQRQYMGRLPDEAGTNVNMLGTLNTQLEASTQGLSRMEQDKSYEEAMLAQQVAQAPASIVPGIAAPSAIAPQAAQMELQSLLAQEADLSSHYTSDYPDVIAIHRKIADVRREIMQVPTRPVSNGSSASSMTPSRYDTPAVQQLRAQIHAAEIGIQEKRREQGQIQAQLRSYEDKVQSSPMVQAQYKQLTRDYQSAQAFYDDLLNKMNSAKMATDLEKRQQGEQFRMVDEANLPDSPFSPKRAGFVIGGLGLGLILGLALVAFLEYRNTAVRNERDVWAFTKLPTLGVIAFSEPSLARGSRLARLKQLLVRKKNPALADVHG